MSRRMLVGLLLVIGRVAPADAQQRAPTADDAGTIRLVRVTRAWPVMGTMFAATVWTSDSSGGAAALRDAHDSVRLVDSLMSTYRPTSEISQVNDQAGRREPVTVSPQTMAVLRRAHLYWRLSGGAFDPTVGPLVNVWRLAALRGEPPSRCVLDSLRALVGLGAVVLDSATSTVRLPRVGMRLDLGGIAKGYALDLARRALANPAIRGGSVDLGGNVLLFGRPPTGEKWRVAIVNPLDPARTIGELAIDYGAVATSGDYERYRMIRGRRYGHLIDPRTGRPARGVLSATAIGPLGEWSDGLSAALFLIGPSRGRALVDSIPGLAAVWVTDRGQRAVRDSDIVCSARTEHLCRHRTTGTRTRSPTVFDAGSDRVRQEAPAATPTSFACKGDAHADPPSIFSGSRIAGASSQRQS